MRPWHCSSKSDPKRVVAQGAPHSPLPSPTGRYAVGRAQFEWTDESRPDSTTPSHKREIVVWAWYPAGLAHDSETAQWMPGKWAEVFWSEYSRGRPGAESQPDFAAIRSHAFTTAAVDSSTKHAVLLFASGSGTTPLDYSAIIEDVASHGFIVLGVESPDFGRATIFADGRVIPGHDPVDRGARLTTAAAIGAWETAASTFGRDLSFALQRLSALKQLPLNRAADLTRVGVFGHSLGGGCSPSVRTR